MKNVVKICCTCKYWDPNLANNPQATAYRRCLHKDNVSRIETNVFSESTCYLHEYLEINPIQIQHTIVNPAAGYHQAIELLTVLYQDGTVMQGRCTAGYGGHAWQEIDVALPTVKRSEKDNA
jgi:hypothetical protein